MEARVKSATRRDVELAQTQVDLAKAQALAERYRMIGQGVRSAFIIVSFTAPILAMKGVIEPLAGKTTVVNVSIVVSIVATVSITGNLFQALKSREQRNTIKRLRAKSTDQERQLALARGGSSS